MDAWWAWRVAGDPTLAPTDAPTVRSLSAEAWKRLVKNQKPTAPVLVPAAAPRVSGSDGRASAVAAISNKKITK